MKLVVTTLNLIIILILFSISFVIYKYDHLIYPENLDDPATRIKFWMELSFNLLGIRKAYNIEHFKQLYRENSKIKFQKLKENQQPYHLDPLPSINATDPQWEIKFQNIFLNQEIPVVVKGLIYNEKYFPGGKEWSIKSVAKDFGKTMVPVFKGKSLKKKKKKNFTAKNFFFF